MKTSERDDTIRLANTILDRPSGDPDDDLAMLSRQFLRALERIERLESDAEIERIKAMTDAECLAAGIAEYGSEEAWREAMDALRSKLLATATARLAAMESVRTRMLAEVCAGTHDEMGRPA